MVFEKDIDEQQDVLRNLFGLGKRDPMVDAYPIQTDTQTALFAEKHGIEFKPENDYFLESFQT